MRILFLENHPMWINGLPNGFRRLGHTVMTYFPDSKTSRVLEEFAPDLVFTMGWTPANETTKKQLSIAKAVKKAQVPLVYWATEDPGYTNMFSLPLIKTMKPDFVFSIHRKTLRRYRKRSIPCAHLDFGYDPDVHRPVPGEQKYRSDAALVANGYTQLFERKPGHYRFQSLRNLVNPFLAEGKKVHFYGRFWDEMRKLYKYRVPDEWIRGYLPYTEANKVYCSVDFVICPQNANDRLTQRTYEILASGGLVITSDTPEVRKLFRPGRDLLVSNSERQTRKLVRKYKNLPKERERIRRNAMKAVQKHSYKNRARYVIDVLKRHQII